FTMPSPVTSIYTQHVQTLPWLAFSTDMPPVEHTKQPMTAAQLQAAFIQEWRAIHQQQIQTLVQSMHRWMTACIVLTVLQVTFDRITLQI
uniref:Uncharacterized protein n=1 Tax=Pundamilia nyererei TaxID=303518 RepID=A0A3B4F2A1_9CICH